MPSPRALLANPYRLGVVVLTVATLCWRAWTVSHWTWQDDDFLFIGKAVDMPLWDYLMQDHNAHLMPAGFLVTKTMVAVAPYDFTVAVAVVALACAANVALWGVALARVTRGSTAALLPLSVLALSPVLMGPMMWWAVAINSVPLQMCLAGTVIFAVQYAESGRRRDLIGLAVVFVIGLLFWQKSVFLTIPLAFVLLASAEGSLRSRLVSVWRALAVLTAISAPYLAFYLYWTRGTSSGNSVETTFEGYTASEVVSNYVRGFEQVLLPSLYGGPWGSLRVSSDAYSNQAETTTLIVLALTAAAVLLVAALDWRALWLVTLPVIYTVVTLGLVLFSSRKQNVWDVMVTERYHVDGVVVAMLTVALLIRALSTRRDVLPALVGRGLLAGTAAVLAVSLAISLVGANIVQDHRIGSRASQQWLENVRRELTSPPEGYGPDRPLVVVDTYAPELVLALAPTWGRYGRLSGMLTPFSSVVRFNEPTDQLWMINQTDGTLERAAVEDLSSSPPGPAEGCGYLLAPGESVDLEMSSALFAWGWGVQLSTFSDQASDLVVTIDETSVPVALPSGPQERTFQYDGAVPETVRVTSTGSAGLVCVTDVTVGSIITAG